MCLIKSADLEGKYTIAEAISQAYRISNINEFFAEDLPLLIEVKQSLIYGDIFLGGITDTICKNYIVDILGGIITRLE